jgi:predicted nucleic acid-binding protein
MIAVMDASAAVAIALRRQDAVRALNICLQADKVIAPKLFEIECANVFWKYVRAGELSGDEANDLYRLVLDLVDDIVDTPEDGIYVLNEAIRLGHSAYDMYYLNLARKYGGILLTTDAKLKALAKKEHIRTV